MKILFLVLSIALFILTIHQISSFKALTLKEKKALDFRTNVLNILQKLVTDEDCLAYAKNASVIKPVIDIKKLENFTKTYQDIEPKCARALDFDYYIKVVQFPKHFKTYPGIRLEEGECDVTQGELGIAVEDPSQATIFIACNASLTPGCCNGTEYDGEIPFTWICDGTIVMCKPYNCSKFLRSKEECEKVNDTTTEKVCCIRENCLKCAGHLHPYLMKCYNIDPEVDCEPLPKQPINACCGLVSYYKKIPVEVSFNATVSEKTWFFSISSNVSSFSPAKAIKDEVTIPLPVSIRYNETYSAEGIIYIKAVKGELEQFYSLLQHICDMAEDKEIKISKEFKFSFPVEKRDNKICMLDKCKLFDCPLSLKMDKLPEGFYILKIVYDPSAREIRVEK